MGKSVWKSPAARLLLLAAGASKIAGFHLPGFVFVDPPSPRITQAPSAAAVELRLRQNLLAPRTVNSCATSCIASAVTKSTSCQLGDTACECKATNAEIIYDGAYGCVAVACGDLIAASVFSQAEDDCLSIAANPGGGTTAVAEPTDGTAVAEPTDGSSVATTAPGGARKSTVVAGDSSPTSGAEPTGSSSGSGSSGSGSGSGSGNGGSSGSNSGSGSSDNSGGGSSLSKGAIIGIAVGAAGGAVVACVLLFVLYKCCRRRDKGEASASAAAVAGGDPSPAPPVADSPQPPSQASPHVVPGTMHKSELASEPKVYAVAPSGTPTPQNGTDVSRQPSVLSSAPSGLGTMGGTISPDSNSVAMSYNPAQPQYPVYATAPQMQGVPQQQHPNQYPLIYNPQQQYPGYGQVPGQPPAGYSEVSAAPPEFRGHTPTPQELPGQAYNGGVYEMPSGAGAPPR